MNKTTGTILIILAAAFAALLGISLLTKQDKAVDYTQYDDTKVISADENNGNIGDHVRGDVDSPVVLVEYGDMQCAGCGTMTPRMKTIYEEYGDRVAFVFRHYPISGHPNSRSAAAAIESAGRQGYFWEMLENLYANQAVWGSESGSSRTEVYAELFQSIAPDGDVEQFKADLGDADIDQKISFDYNVGTKLSDVQATPSFFIGGELIDITNVSGEEAFLEVLRSALDRNLEAAGLATGPNATADSATEADSETTANNTESTETQD